MLPVQTALPLVFNVHRVPIRISPVQIALQLAFNVQPVPIRMSLVQIALQLVSNVQLALIRNRKELLFAPFVQLVPILML